jgi:hypothetical protein
METSRRAACRSLGRRRELDRRDASVERVGMRVVTEDIVFEEELE